MSTCNVNSILVDSHNLSKKLCTGKHWKPRFLSCLEFGIIRVNCCCIYNKIYIISYITGALWYGYDTAVPDKFVSKS